MKRGFCDEETAAVLTPAHKHRKCANISQQFFDTQAHIKSECLTQEKEHLFQQCRALEAENLDLKSRAQAGGNSCNEAGQGPEQRRRVYGMSNQQSMQQPTTRSGLFC
jgi:hypothetical protein